MITCISEQKYKERLNRGPNNPLPLSCRVPTEHRLWARMSDHLEAVMGRQSAQGEISKRDARRALLSPSNPYTLMAQFVEEGKKARLSYLSVRAFSDEDRDVICEMVRKIVDFEINFTNLTDWIKADVKLTGVGTESLMIALETDHTFDEMTAHQRHGFMVLLLGIYKRLRLDIYENLQLRRPYMPPMAMEPDMRCDFQLYGRDLIYADELIWMGSAQEEQILQDYIAREAEKWPGRFDSVVITFKSDAQ